MTNTDKYPKTQTSLTAQKCPVCNGFGTLKYGSLICHGCKGKGYVVINVAIQRKDILK